MGSNLKTGNGCLGSEICSFGFKDYMQGTENHLFWSEIGLGLVFALGVVVVPPIQCFRQWAKM